MSYTVVRYDVDDRVATITLDRPQSRNGFTVAMADELRAAFDAADRDEDVRVVVVTGAGKDFCVGADLSGAGLSSPSAQPPPDAAGAAGVAGAASSSNDAAALAEWSEPAGRVSTRVYAMNKPVIAALNGAAAGAGLTVVLAADFRLGATNSKFGFVFSRRGIAAEGCSHWLLPRLVGQARATDWMLTGRVFGADEALAAGLLRSVHEPEELLPAAYALARELASTTAPVSVALSRRLMFEAHTMTLDEVHRLESRLVAHTMRSTDVVEGVTSFLQRRPPRFTGTLAGDLPDFLPWD